MKTYGKGSIKLGVGYAFPLKPEIIFKTMASWKVESLGLKLNLKPNPYIQERSQPIISADLNVKLESYALPLNVQDKNNLADLLFDTRT